MAIELGRSIATNNTEAKRDALHVPVVPGVVVGDMAPGAPVKFTQDGKSVVACMSRRDAHGIVDPFYSTRPFVPDGTRVWIMLMPGAVTNLRHDWSVPFLPDNNSVDVESSADGDDDDSDDSCRGCY